MIVGFNIDSLDAEKSKQAGAGGLQVNYEPEILDVSEATVRQFDEEVAKIEFEFNVNYDVGNATAAHITMSGNILWKGGIEDAVETFEEDGTLPDEIHAPLMNDMYRKCLSQAVGVADTLNLLPPIPTPRIEQ